MPHYLAPWRVEAHGEILDRGETGLSLVKWQKGDYKRGSKKENLLEIARLRHISGISFIKRGAYGLGTGSFRPLCACIDLGK